mgnify:CR=1 FL=1
MGERRIHRRNFIKSTLLGVGGMVLSTPGFRQEVKAAEVKGKDRKFVYRVLGKTGLKIPVINMGVMLTDNPNLIRTALDSGITLLDTAHGYMGGRNEEVIGSVIKGRPRDSFYIASKVSLPQDRKTGFYTEGATTKGFLARLDTSLKRLGLDHIDILYQHGVSRKESVMYEPVLTAFEKAKKEGKIRFSGVSTHANEPEVIEAVTDSKMHEVVLTAYTFKQKHAESVRRAIARASQAGIGVVAMKAIRGGYQKPPSATNVTASLKWILRSPNVTTVIAGFTAFEHIDLDLSVMEDLNLTEPEELEIRKEAALRGLYCQGCGVCLGQCPAELPIPDLMRAYMYAYGYGSLSYAREVIGALELPKKPCGDCASCSVKCSIGFDVPGKIQKIVHLG